MVFRILVRYHRPTLHVNPTPHAEVPVRFIFFIFSAITVRSSPGVCPYVIGGGVFVPQEAMSVRGRVRVDFVRKGLPGYLSE